MTGITLTIQNLSRSFKGKKVLDGFNLSVEDGEFVSILGASGSGKSTLLRLIAHLDEPTSGSIVNSTLDKSFVFQDANLLPWRSLQKNLELVFELTQKPVDHNRIREVLSLVGLNDDVAKFPSELSGGMKMRASLARALLLNPKLLLLDEPFSSLDEQTRLRLQDELYQIWQKQKMTVIFVTHSISEAVFLSERVVAIRRGQVVMNRQLSFNRGANMRVSEKYISEVQNISRELADE